MTVHNHGTEDGPGLACPESRINGELKGKCMGVQVIPEAAVEAARRAVYKARWVDAFGPKGVIATDEVLARAALEAAAQLGFHIGSDCGTNTKPPTP